MNVFGLLTLKSRAWPGPACAKVIFTHTFISIFYVSEVFCEIYQYPKTLSCISHDIFLLVISYSILALVFGSSTESAKCSPVINDFATACHTFLWQIPATWTEQRQSAQLNQLEHEACDLDIVGSIPGLTNQNYLSVFRTRLQIGQDFKSRSHIWVLKHLAR
jgi:hypothetical protein